MRERKRDESRNFTNDVNAAMVFCKMDGCDWDGYVCGWLGGVHMLLLYGAGRAGNEGRLMMLRDLSPFFWV